MLYISAQPDTYYFLWQLKLQLFNFNRLGICSNYIHVLIGYDKENGISSYFNSFIEKNDQARFFTYPDTRKNKKYDSSLRPHILAKHYMANTWLKNEPIFYHDSDIIFTRLPNFESLLKNDIWYASDTRAYNDSYYIRGKIGEKGFNGMTKIMGMSSTVIEQHDQHVGGAQYLLKNIDVYFWSSLEKNCEKMYEYLNDLNNNQVDKAKKIQAWCTDMWCLWWQAIKIGKKVRIHRLLDFMWAHTPIVDNIHPLILHYTGNIKEKDIHYFRKNNYGRCTPFYDDFSHIDHQSASGLLLLEIKRYNKHQLKNRLDLTDVSFLIPIRIDSRDRLENLRIVTNYIHIHFKTNIIIIEADSEQKVDPSKLPEEVEFHFIKDDEFLFHRTKYNNRLISLSNTPFISIYDTDAILPVNQILESIIKLRKSLADVVYPYDGKFVSIDILMKNMFAKLLDVGFLEANKGKHRIASDRSYGGCVFLNKRSFWDAGGENENITSWGPDDIERKRRMQTLGYKIERIGGNLYHLPHLRLDNSRYFNLQHRMRLMDEYLKVCRMSPTELKNYINTWAWKQELTKDI